jgi:uncharacterized protein (TIGR02145 family)
MKKLLVILLLIPFLCSGQSLFHAQNRNSLGTFVEQYGLLYNHYAVADERGLTSSGWSVPTQTQIQTLADYLGASGDYSTTNTVGGKLKETGLTYWTSPNTAATNEVDFNLRGSSTRSNTGVFGDLKSTFRMWSSTTIGSGGGYGEIVYNDDYFRCQSSSSYNSTFGFSLRPVKNTTSLSHGETGTYTGNDGTVYPTICIGTQEWLAVNLRETRYANGDLIPNVTDNTEWSNLTTGALSSYNNIAFDVPEYTPSSTLLDGLVAAWEMDETEGTTMIDETGSHNGTIGTGVDINQAGVSPTKSHYFNNTVGVYNTVPNHSSLTPVDSFAFSTSINIPSLVGVRYVLGKPTEYRLDVTTDGNFGMRFFENGTTNYIGFRTTNAPIVIDTTYHVVVNIIDLKLVGAATSQIEIWIDGEIQPIERFGNMSSMTVGIVNSANDLLIGAGTTAIRFLGNISQVAFFDDTLEEGEITTLYNNGDGILFSELADVGGEEETFLASADYYVSSSTGSDTNDGLTEETAWATLSKVSSETFSAGDIIALKASDTFEGTIAPLNSGTEGNPIVFSAYGTGQKPKIYGSEGITGWTLHSGNIYKATVTDVVTQVFVDDSAIRAARFPNTGYAYPSSVDDVDQFTDTDLNPAIDYTGANCYYKGARYKYTPSTITNSNSQTLTLSNAPFGGLATNKGYILTNKLEFLDQAGEWYYDSSTNTLYVWMPTSDSPASYNVRASVYNYGLYVFHRDHLTFENLEVYHAADRGFYGNHVNHITVNNCNFYYSERYGMRVSDGSQSFITVSNCEVKGANDSGISIYGPNSNISDNVVSDIGLFETIGIGDIGTGIGIKSQGTNNIVSFNRVTNIGYNGIDFFGENQLITKNYVNGAQMAYDDGGGIYTVNAGTYSDVGSAGSVVSNNIVLNVRGNPEGTPETYEGSLGIYLDRNVHDVIVEHNTIATVSGGIILGGSNGHNIIRNNTIMNFTIALYMGGNHATDYNNVNNNIIFASDELRTYPWWTNKPQRFARIASIAGVYDAYRGDNNKFYQKYFPDDLFDSNGDGIFESFASWQTATEQDVNSTVDISPLGAGEVEELFYNDTKDAKVITLTGSYRDLDGDAVASPLVLQPFTSQILIKE